MKKMKKIGLTLSVLALLLVVPFVMVGCGGGRGPSVAQLTEGRWELTSSSADFRMTIAGEHLFDESITLTPGDPGWIAGWLEFTETTDGDNTFIGFGEDGNVSGTWTISGRTLVMTPPNLDMIDTELFEDFPNFRIEQLFTYRATINSDGTELTLTNNVSLSTSFMGIRMSIRVRSTEVFQLATPDAA